MSRTRLRTFALAIGAAAVALGGGAPREPEKAPAKTEKGFMQTQDLVKLARVKASGEVADEFRQLLPVPVRTPEGLQVVFLFAPALALPGQPVKLNPPHYSLRLRAEDGGLVELRPVTPAEFGQSHRLNDVIGEFGLPDGWTADQFMQRLEELYAVYDELLPVFAKGRAAGQEPARRFHDLFVQLSEPPLRPYYTAAGREFFSWIDEAAR